MRSGGSGGGLDILGVYFTKKFSDFSVGRLSNIINVLVFGVCAILFNVTTAIYSIIYTACMYLVVDKTHYQNINMTAMIFTKEDVYKRQTLYNAFFTTLIHKPAEISSMLAPFFCACLTLEFIKTVQRVPRSTGCLPASPMRANS